MRFLPRWFRDRGMESGFLLVIDLVSQGKEATNIFPARRADLEMNIEHFALGSVHLTVGQSHELVVIDVFMPELELRRQAYLQRLRPALASKHLSELMFT